MSKMYRAAGAMVELSKTVIEEMGALGLLSPEFEAHVLSIAYKAKDAQRKVLELVGQLETPIPEEEIDNWHEDSETS